MSRYWGRIAAGLVLAALIASLIAALLLSLGVASARFPGTGAPARDVGHLFRTTLLQASLSTLVSIVSGIAIAWALDRVAFPGRNAFVAVLSTGLVLPALVVAFGVVAVWGRAGWINDGLLALTGARLPGTIFGLHGIVFCHLILNGALAARVCYNRLAAMPARKLKLGRSLALGPLDRFLALDWPAIRAAIPSLAAVIFLFCFTSFAVVLTLGGGPSNATFEVAIYESVRLDFDPGLAARLALIQLAICFVVIVPAAGWPLGAALIGRPPTLPHWPDHGPARALQIATIMLAALIFGLPMLAVLAGAIAPGALATLASPAFATALATSLIVATCSAALAIALALVLALARANVALIAATGVPAGWARLLIGAPAFAYLAMPALVLALGFFLLARLTGAAPDAVAPAILVLANALLALPLAAAILGPPLERLSASTARLQRSLALSGWRRLLDIELPLIRPDLGYAAAVAFCLSLGDLGVIALFGNADFSTLPWLMYRAMGSYRNADAATVAAALLVLTVFALLLIPRLIAGPRHVDA
ncbi:MAG: thiamine/thiamine pyrophosphate ABC transporter permease ThiP [Cucumibacter sp.]